MGFPGVSTSVPFQKTNLGSSPPAPIAPLNIEAPINSGSIDEGATLSCTTGIWTGTAPITYTYQWTRGGVNIGGATNNTYVLVLADSQAAILCVVTATNVAAPSGVSANSNTLTAGNYKPVYVIAPVISGNNILGATLTATNGTATGTSITYSRKWYRDGVEIAGETATTYVVVVADLGKTITVTGTATNTAGNASSTSNGIVILNLPLDGITIATIKAAWSAMFQLLSSFGTSAAGTRLRNTGLTEQDFPFSDTNKINQTDVATLRGVAFVFNKIIADQSANANHATNATVGTQPTYVANVIGSNLGAPLSNGATTSLPIASEINMGKNYSLISVVRMTGNYASVFCGAHGVTEHVGLFSGAGSVYHYVANQGAHVTYTIPNNETHIVEIRRRGTTTIEFFVDGISKGTNALTTNNDFYFDNLINNSFGDDHMGYFDACVALINPVDAEVNAAVTKLKTLYSIA